MQLAVAAVTDRNNVTSLPCWLRLVQLDGGVCVVFGQGPSFLCASVDAHWTVTGVPAEHGGVTGGVIIVLAVRWIIS